MPELDSQLARFDEMAHDVAARRAHLAQCSALFEDMTTRLQVVRETVGAKVEELKRRLATTRSAVVGGASC